MVITIGIKQDLIYFILLSFSSPLILVSFLVSYLFLSSSTSFFLHFPSIISCISYHLDYFLHLSVSFFSFVYLFSTLFIIKLPFLRGLPGYVCRVGEPSFRTGDNPQVPQPTKKYNKCYHILPIYRTARIRKHLTER